MPTWAAFVLFGLPFVLGSLLWIRKRDPAHRPAQVSAQLRAKLGDTLTSWLVATNQLRAELIAFERGAREMLKQEHEQRLPSGRRHPRREMDGTNFLVEIRNARRAGQRWLARGASFSEADRHRIDVDVESFAALFEFPWAFETEAARSNDRSGELEAILEQCAAASRVLAQVDATLTNLGRAAYR